MSIVKRVSSKHAADQWSADLSDINSPAWLDAIEIVRDRFESRYFKPISQLENSSDLKVKYSCGFLIMSIDCLLIETLNQFYLGLYTSEEKYFKTNPDPNFKFNRQAFRDFFRHSTYFPDFKISEDLSNVFYKEIRCGLIHQAQSKTNSLINLRLSAMITPIDPTDISRGIVVNRKIFHKALVDEFDKYLTNLTDPASVNLFGDNLREKCNRKMADLCS